MVPIAFAASPHTMSLSSVIQQFKIEFPCAENVQWKETPNDFQANFKMNNMRQWLVLNKDDGSQMFLVKYYDESSLKPDLKQCITRKFAKAHICGVTEINSPERTVYQVSVESKNKLYILLMDEDGNIAVKDWFKKSS